MMYQVNHEAAIKQANFLNLTGAARSEFIQWCCLFEIRTYQITKERVLEKEEQLAVDALRRAHALHNELHWKETPALRSEMGG